MATRREVVRHLERLATILTNLGAEVPAPILDEFDDGGLRFAMSADLPGPPPPRATEIWLREVWAAAGAGSYRLAEYEYDFADRPMDRRRAFHRHHEAEFLDRYAVAVHEHCEETLGAPARSHNYGLPVDAYEAIRRFTVLWAQSGPLGCGDLRCME